MNNQKLDIQHFLQSLHQQPNSNATSTQNISNNFFIFSDSSCLNLENFNSSTHSNFNVGLIENLIKKIKNAASQIEALSREIDQINKILEKIQIEVRQNQPRKDVLKSYIELFPISMNTITSLSQLLVALGT